MEKKLELVFTAINFNAEIEGEKVILICLLPKENSENLLEKLKSSFAGDWRDYACFLIEQEEEMVLKIPAWAIPETTTETFMQIDVEDVEMPTIQRIDFADFT